MNDTSFIYRRLIVWKKAMRLWRLVYAEVRKFPVEERYALSDQIRRAVVSIASNIAEGAGRSSQKDYGHFISIARGSQYETMTQLEGAESLGYMTITEEIQNLAAEISKMLMSMLKKSNAITSTPTQTSTPTIISH